MVRVTVSWESGRSMDLLFPVSTPGLAVLGRVEQIDPSPLHLVKHQRVR